MEQSKYTYNIVDTDFEAEVYVKHDAVETAVINEYKKRNLNVIPNLILAILYSIKIDGFSLAYIISVNNNSDFLEYKDDLEKYLILL